MASAPMNSSTAQFNTRQSMVRKRLAEEKSNKAMVDSLRVVELKALLLWAKKVPGGSLKASLLKAAHELIEPLSEVSPTLAAKIQELYRKRHGLPAESLDLPEAMDVTEQTNDRESVLYSSLIEREPFRTRVSQIPLPPSPPLRPSTSVQNSQQCDAKENAIRNDPLAVACSPLFEQPSQSFEPTAKVPTSVVPSPPGLKLQPLPFYDVIETLIEPTTLRQTEMVGCTVFRERNFYFKMAPLPTSKAVCAPQLAAYPGHYGPSPMLPGVEVQLRFCLNELKSVQEDDYPLDLSIKVNRCAVMDLPDLVADRRESKRPPQPLDITQFCYLTANVCNVINVKWTVQSHHVFQVIPAPNTLHAISVNLVRRNSADELFNRVKARGPRSVDVTRSLVKQLLADDELISTTSLKAPLLCPLGKTRLENPCRSNTCQHVPCFDLLAFLQLNEKKPAWKCPICNQKLMFEDLFIDGMFQEILANSPKTCVQVDLGAFGGWTALSPDSPETVRNAEDTRDSIEIINDESTDEESKKPAKKRRSVKSGRATNKANEVIVLSSDDEDKTRNPAEVVHMIRYGLSRGWQEVLDKRRKQGIEKRN